MSDFKTIMTSKLLYEMFVPLTNAIKNFEIYQYEMSLFSFLRQEMHNQYACLGSRHTLEIVLFFVHYAEKPTLTDVQKPNAAYCTKQSLLQSIVCEV